ncbi:tetratricopeptide (TPR) repeat protein [Streptacidiphilus sp. BW17]|uniref:helix-turn-helix domain-containing protein n=1 Tax=Streptacidiphilus sp. BW17 TaxID=3156274 RepID=UPI00351100F3
MLDEPRNDMRERRRASGVRWAQFARAAGFAEAYLRNVENGNRALTAEVAAAYDRVLGTGGEFSESLAAAVAGGAKDAPWDRDGGIAVLSELVDGGRGVDRRSFLASGVALSVSASNWARTLDVSRQAVLLAGGTRQLNGIDDRLDELRHLDDELGSGEVHRLARGELLYAVTLIKTGRHTGASLDHLYSLAAEAARQVAWSAFDQGRPGVAQRYFDGSLRASAIAGDPVSGAYTLSFAAIQCYSTPQQAQRAVSLLETAQEKIKRRTTPRMGAMLAARTARALSKTGAKKECARQLATARALLDKGVHDDDPRALYWVDYGEIEMIAGSSALQLGDPEEALRCFQAAMSAAYPGDDEYPRSHAIYMARAAEAHIARHDLDAAVASARHAARCLGIVDSARSASELAGLRSQLAKHTAHPAVRDFLGVG